MAFPLLNISPSQLEFLFEADRELKSTLNLRNVNEGVRVAFKIKTTNADRFVVCPPTGIVEPGTTRIVKIYLKAQRDYDEDLRLCKDRFLVQSIQVDAELNDADVASGMFRSAQRQEAKLKVVVAAPLAHSSVLENEIRTIAQRQGIEGHRAAMRKFSELLLARGIISQAQVVLAFSTVGEIFQGMHGSLRVERDFDYNSILPDRNASLPDRSIAAEAPAAAAPPAGGAPAGGRGADDFTPTPRGGGQQDGPFRLQSQALFTAVGPKSEAQTGARQAASSAAPYSQTPNGQASVDTTAPAAAAAKADAIYSSAGSGGLEAAAAAEAAAAVPPPRTPPAARAADQTAPLSASEPASPDQRAATAEPAAHASDRPSARPAAAPELEKAEVLPTEAEKAEVAPSAAAPPRDATRYVTPAARRPPPGFSGRSNGTAEGDDTDLAFQHTDMDRRAKPATKRLLRPRRTIGELGGAPPAASAAEEPSAAEAAGAPAQPAGMEIMPELTQLDKQQSLSGRANWPATADSLGRLNPVTRIDRLATPAYRKTSLPAASRRIDAVLANAQGGGRADEELAPRASAGADSEAFASPSGSRELESQNSVGSAADVPAPPPPAIPRGNTLKMASFFGRGRQ